MATGATLISGLAGISAQETCGRPKLAFRLDDVQDWWLSEAQRAVIELFSAHSVPVTLGIIGGFIGEDTALLSVIRANLNLVEIANHGFHAKNDGTGQSALLSQDPSLTFEELDRANRRIEALFARRPEVFIPHQNQFNPSLLRTLSRLNFRYISSACLWHLDAAFPCEDPCGYGGSIPCQQPSEFGLVHLPAGASTEWEPQVGKAFDDTLHVQAQIGSSLDRYGFAVMMIHPQDFVLPDEGIDVHALASLNKLLQALKDSGVAKPSRLSEVARTCSRR
jgi:hypothetical protein